MTLSDLEPWLLGLLTLLASAALGLTLFAIVVARRQVGEVLHVVRAGKGLRGLLAVCCLFASSAVFLGEVSSLALVPLALGAIVAWLAPGLEDMVLGTDGARRGWQARRWEQLEGWRLEGNHLRFLVHGELVAVEVPDAEMAALEAKLAEHCPESRSPLGRPATHEQDQQA